MAQTKPLDGIRIVDFSRVMAGPFCTALLADLGAEVIKVESATGDDYRHIGPFRNGESALFLSFNRGKKSIVIDLKADDGREVAHGLIANSDVVVENFRPGVARKLGIDYDAARRINERIVYLSISGFGQEGPLADRPSYDIIAQAMAGMMSMTGDPDGPPMRVGDALGDLSAGLYGAWGVTAALFGRERTGEGRYLDIAMFDAIFSFLPTPFAMFMLAGASPVRSGNRHLLSAPFGSFRAADGDVIIAVANNALFERLLDAIERADLRDDPRFASDEERNRNELQLRDIIESWASSRSVEAVVDRLGAFGVPASPIWTVEQAATSAHAACRELLAQMVHPIAGDISVVEQPVHFSEVARGELGPAPLLGEHTRTTLRDILDLDDDRIAALEAAGTIASGDSKPG
jgi:CoA:oxalate CoA-transferase